MGVVLGLREKRKLIVRNALGKTGPGLDAGNSRAGGREGG